MKKIYIHEIAARNFSKIYFLKNRKKICKPNKHNLNCDWSRRLSILCRIPNIKIAWMNPWSSNHNFWYTCANYDNSRCFFHFFEILFFFELLWGKRAKNSPKWKNNNCIRYAPYPRNSIPYDHDFWYTCVKWWYLQLNFSFFWNFIFQGS